MPEDVTAGELDPNELARALAPLNPRVAVRNSNSRRRDASGRQALAERLAGILCARSA